MWPKKIAEGEWKRRLAIVLSLYQEGVTDKKELARITSFPDNTIQKCISELRSTGAINSVREELVAKHLPRRQRRMVVIESLLGHGWTKKRIRTVLQISGERLRQIIAEAPGLVALEQCAKGAAQKPGKNGNGKV